MPYFALIIMYYHVKIACYQCFEYVIQYIPLHWMFLTLEPNTYLLKHIVWLDTHGVGNSACRLG